MAGMRTVYLLVTKALRVELRNRETFTVMLFFAVVILFLFHFSLNPERENTTQLAPGLCWSAGFPYRSIAETRSDRIEPTSPVVFGPFHL